MRGLKNLCVSLFIFVLALGSVAASPSLPADALLNQAIKAFNAGDTESSRATVLQALKTHPFSYLKPDLVLLLASTYLKEGDWEQSEIIFKGLKSMYPGFENDPRSQLMEASIFQAQGELDKAIGILANQKTGPALYQSGVLLENTNRSFAAIKHFLDLKSQFPQTDLAPMAVVGLAASYLSLKDYDAALQTLDEASSQNIYSEYLKASVLYKQEEYAETVKILAPLSESIKMDGIHYFARNLMGLAALKAGMENLAIDAFKKNLDSENVTCLNRSGIELCGLYLKKEKPRDAIEVCNTILGQRRPKEIKAPFYLLRGLAYQHSAQPTLAIKDFEEVAFMNHSEWSPRAYLFLGQILRTEQNPTRLVTDYYQSLKVFREELKGNYSGDDLDWSWVIVGEAQYSLQNYREAQNIYEQVLDRAPGSALSAQAVSGLVASLVIQKKFDLAQSKIHELMVRFGEDRKVAQFCLLSEAHLLWNQQKFQKAADSYEKYAAMFSDSNNVDLAIYQWGRASEKNGEFDAALSAWERLRKNYPASPYYYRSLVKSAQVAQKGGYAGKSQSYYQMMAESKNGEGAKLALLQLGRIAMASNQYEESLRYFSEFAQNYSDSPELDQVLKLAQDAAHRLAQSSPVRLDILAVDYNNSFIGGEVLYQLGLLAMDEKKLEQAFQFFDKTVREFPLAPSSAMALFHKGKVQYMQGHFELALDTLGDFVNSYGEHDMTVTARYYRGMSMLKSDFPREAILVFEDLIKKDPLSYFSAKALLNIAEAQNQLQNPQGQADAYQRYVDQYYESENIHPVLFALGSLKKRLGDYPGALGFLKQVDYKRAQVNESELMAVLKNLEELIQARRTQ